MTRKISEFGISESAEFYGYNVIDIREFFDIEMNIDDATNKSDIIDIIKSSINWELAFAREIEMSDRNDLIKLHFEMDMLKCSIYHSSTEDVSIMRKRIIERCETLEFKMQECWKFDLSVDHHTHWFNLPKCKCPRLDNYDLLGCSKRVYNYSCPIHGS